MRPHDVSRYESLMQKTFAALTAAAFLAALGGCSTVHNESSTPAMQTPHRFQGKVTHTVKLDYLLFLPGGYKKSGTNKWPLMLFLHGSGERGTNVDKVTVHGPPKIVKTKKDFPFILVSPQCPDERTWRDILESNEAPPPVLAEGLELLARRAIERW